MMQEIKYNWMTCEQELIGRTFSDFLFRPRKGIVYSRHDVDIQSNLTTFLSLTLPVLSANMDTVTSEHVALAMAENGGLGIIHRNCSIDEQVRMVKFVKSKERLVGAAVGVNGDYIDRAAALCEACVDLLVIDTAHGHSENLSNAAHIIKGPRFSEVAYFGPPIMAGNVATYDGARYLADNGVQIIKVGIGPGSACTTRLSTGMGVPQLQAIREAWWASRFYPNVSIVADGGIKDDKDIFLSLLCGAGAVMLGKAIAMTKEAFFSNGNRYTYRGMASKEAQPGKYVAAPEGLAFDFIPYDHVDMPTIAQVSDRIKGHLQSSLSYAGVKSLKQLQHELTPNITDHLIPLSEASRQESFVR